jgi:hypothetical protein
MDQDERERTAANLLFRYPPYWDTAGWHIVVEHPDSSPDIIHENYHGSGIAVELLVFREALNYRPI